MQVTATEAKNRFGSLCAEAKRAPITVLKDGRPDSVIMSFAYFQNFNPASSTSMAQRQKEFAKTYKDWIAAQHDNFEKNGLWCEGAVSWMEPA
jgi:prevent-host-death family protein